MDSGSNSTSTNSEINANSSRNLQFLAVESSPRSLSELTTMLVKANYEGKTCTTLDRAFKLVQDKPSDGFDFLVCDSVSALRQLELVELISSKFDVIVVVVLREDEKLEPATEKRLKDSECYCCTVAESSGLVEMIPLLVSGKRNPPAASSESKTQSDDAVVESSSVHKKKRLVWDPELNSRFLRAIQQLESNSKKICPKGIRELMGDSSITRDQIASHLQKYRQNMKKEEDSGAVNHGNSSGDLLLNHQNACVPHPTVGISSAAIAAIGVEDARCSGGNMQTGPNGLASSPQLMAVNHGDSSSGGLLRNHQNACVPRPTVGISSAATAAIGVEDARCSGGNMQTGLNGMASTPQLMAVNHGDSSSGGLLRNHQNACVTRPTVEISSAATAARWSGGYMQTGLNSDQLKALLLQRCREWQEMCRNVQTAQPPVVPFYRTAGLPFRQFRHAERSQFQPYSHAAAAAAPLNRSEIQPSDQTVGPSIRPHLQIRPNGSMGQLQFQLFDQQQQTFATYYNPLTGEPDGVTAVFIDDDSRQTQQPVPNDFGYEPSPNLPNNEQSSESVMTGNNNDENRDETNIWLNV